MVFLAILLFLTRFFFGLKFFSSLFDSFFCEYIMLLFFRIEMNFVIFTWNESTVDCVKYILVAVTTIDKRIRWWNFTQWKVDGKNVKNLDHQRLKYFWNWSKKANWKCNIKSNPFYRNRKIFEEQRKWFPLS